MTTTAREPLASTPETDAVLAFSEEGVSRACHLHEQALALRAERRTAEAEELARQALTLLTLTLGPNDPEVANVFLCLGGLREDTGDLATAERLYRYALQILERAEPDVAVIRLRVQALGLLANIRQVRGHYGASERIFRRALALAEEHLAPDDLDIANLLNGLGILHKYQGRYDDAEPVYHRALAILEAAFGHGIDRLQSGHPAGRSRLLRRSRSAL